MRCYLDTSAIIKWFVDEVGSSESVGALETADASWTCRITYPETRAAMAALRRGGRVDDARAAAIRTSLDEIRWPRLSVVEVTDELARQAGDLAERHAMRGFDAIHLAAALAIGGDDLVVVTWDQRLWDAARSEGIRVLPLEGRGV